MLGELVRTTTGQWITHPPSRSSNGTASGRIKSLSGTSHALDMAAVGIQAGGAEPAMPWCAGRQWPSTAPHLKVQRPCESPASRRHPVRVAIPRGAAMYLHSRSKRWLGVLRKSQSVLQLARQSVASFAEAATQMKGVRVISERDQQVMTLMARDPIALTSESQLLGGDSWLAETLQPVKQSRGDFAFGEGFDGSLEKLASAAEAAIPLLQARVTEPDPSIDEIVDELERAFLISLIVTLTSHNVLLQKVDEWEQPHQRFMQGHLPPT